MKKSCLVLAALTILFAIAPGVWGLPEPAGQEEEAPSASTDSKDIFKHLKFRNIGPAVAAFLRRLGLSSPEDLKGRDPYAMFDDLNRITGQRYDPCLLDTFIAAVRFMAGEPKRPWWKYTAERKRELAARNARSQ